MNPLQNPPYKVLIVEKSLEECVEQYSAYAHTFGAERMQTLANRHFQALTRVAESEARILKDEGYHIESFQGVGSLTEGRYAQMDCVLVHSPAGKIPFIEYLHQAYPSTGLILTTGNGRGPEHDFAREKKGVYILVKPYSPDTFLQCVREAIRDAKEAPSLA